MKPRSGFGWLEILTGVLLIVPGILVLMNPAPAVARLIAACIMGIADIILYIQVERFVGFGPIISLLTGILSVMAGIMLILYPKAVVPVLTVLFPMWFIAHCISRLLQLNHIRFIAGNGICIFTLVVNIIGLFLGFMMLMRLIFTLTTISYLAGAYLVLLGVDAVVIGISRLGTRF